MNQQQFVTHALIAAGLQDELEEDEELTEDSLYGLFQCFMPDGAGVEAVFQPLSTGKALHERIQPIYAATQSSAKEALENGCAPPISAPKAAQTKPHSNALVRIIWTASKPSPVLLRTTNCCGGWMRCQKSLSASIPSANTTAWKKC